MWSISNNFKIKLKNKDKKQNKNRTNYKDSLH